jgi:hypothetical protein
MLNALCFIPLFDGPAPLARGLAAEEDAIPQALSRAKGKPTP